VIYFDHNDAESYMKKIFPNAIREYHSHELTHHQTHKTFIRFDKVLITAINGDRYYHVGIGKDEKYVRCSDPKLIVDKWQRLDINDNPMYQFKITEIKINGIENIPERIIKNDNEIDRDEIKILQTIKEKQTELKEQIDKLNREWDQLYYQARDIEDKRKQESDKIKETQYHNTIIKLRDSEPKPEIQILTDPKCSNCGEYYSINNWKNPHEDDREMATYYSCNRH
jgi:hypothetical protein